MKTVEFGEGSVMGEISRAVYLADQAGRYFNKVVLSPEEYAAVRKELALTSENYHPTALPVYGGRSTFYMVKPAEGEEYNPGLRQQENDLKQQLEAMRGIVPIEDEDDELPGERGPVGDVLAGAFCEHLAYDIDSKVLELVGTETGIPAPGSDSKQ